MANIAKSGFTIPKTSKRTLALYIKGKQVSKDHIYRYTNGRFIVNEEYELAKRYSPFDVDSLCRIVSSLPSVASPITRVEKKEGGYNKALLMTAESGRTVIAKVPCRNIVPKEYGTASEVAVLRFVREHSSTPVSKILSWTANANNPARTEYIILEKSNGRQLTDIWETLTEPQKSTLIRKFAELESRLAAVDFPGYGALYFRDALPVNLQKAVRAGEDRIIDVDDTYVLGPMYHGSWPGGFAADPEEYAQFSGPWTNLTDLSRDLVHQGIWQIENFRTSHAGRGPHYGTPTEHIATLHKALAVMPFLTNLPALKRHGGPVLCHPDFHPGNIFVDRADPTIVDGIVDWQYANILPRFTKVRWPLCLTLPRDRFHRKHHQETDEAMRVKCYEAALVKSRMEAYLELPEPDVAVRKLFTLCSFTYRDGIVTVRDCLVKIFQYWSQLGFGVPCPYSFSREQIVEHERQYADYQEWLKLREHTHELLKSNDGGWIPPGIDFEETKRKHEKLYESFIRTKTKQMSEQEAEKLWFFRERY